MAARYDISRDIHLPAAMAVWVLGAHLYAILLPLLLLAAMLNHWGALTEVADYPRLLLAAVGLMMAGSAFEVAQNAADHWYLTKDTGSAQGTGFCDFMFYFFVVLSQATMAIGFYGQSFWLTACCLLAVVIFPFLYFRQVAQFAPLGLVGLLAAGAAFLKLGDPVVLLQLVLTPLTLFFFNGLLKTGAQFLHGLTTLAASSGVLLLAWGIHGGLTGQPQSWGAVIVSVVLVAICVLLLRPVLLQLDATPRRAGSNSSA